MQTTTPAIAPIRFVPSGQQAAAAPGKPQCASCHLRELCLPAGLRDDEVARLDALLFARRRVKQGESLFRERDRFQFIYAVRSGTFKTISMLKDGREHVSGFQLAGDMLGLDGLADGHHASEAVALEDAEICAIPYAQLASLAAQNRELRDALTRLMSREIVREHNPMLLLGSMNAEERVAAFLLNISQRMKSRGYSAREFHLRMSRAEIGSYLGMKLETVSRTFSAFQQQRMLEVAKKHIRITDLDGLSRTYEVRVH
jgi:CRP/FNR family transcriptional regulator